MEEAQIEEAITKFIAIPVMMIIALYLLACIIAPLANLNNQTFRIVFTAVGGAPALFFYQKSKRAAKSKERRPHKNTIKL